MNPTTGTLRQSLRRPTLAGFSLVEMLAVSAIVVLMMSMLGVSIASMTAQSARRGAVDMVLNAFEQARVAALRESARVYVGFADANYPIAEDRYRAMIVFRDRVDSDPAWTGSGPPPQYVALTKWRKLPRGISFKSVANPLLGANAHLVTRGDNDPIPNIPGGSTLPVLVFNQTGAIQQPAAAALRLMIYEGFYDGSQDVMSMNSASSLFEIFTFSRFTGRIRHEVSMLNP